MTTGETKKNEENKLKFTKYDDCYSDIGFTYIEIDNGQSLKFLLFIISISRR